MKKVIQNLRNQPEQFRTHILHAVTIVAGVILIFLWIYSLGTNLSNGDTQAKLENDLKPFSALKANIVGGYESLTTPDLNTQLDTE